MQKFKFIIIFRFKTDRFEITLGIREINKFKQPKYKVA